MGANDTGSKNQSKVSQDCQFLIAMAETIIYYLQNAIQDSRKNVYADTRKAIHSLDLALLIGTSNINYIDTEKISHCTVIIKHVH